MGLVQCEPFLRLPDAVVVKLVVYLPRAQRGEQVAPDVGGKLAGVNRYAGGGGHVSFFGEAGRAAAASNFVLDFEAVVLKKHFRRELFDLVVGKKSLAGQAQPGGRTLEDPTGTD